MTKEVAAQSTAVKSMTEADDQFEIKLIKEIKKYPCLYDINHIDYRSEQLKKFAWITISNDLDKTIRECLDKWYFALQHFWHDYRLEKDGCRTKKHWSSYESMKKMVSYLADKSYGEKLFKSPFIDSKPTKKQYKMLISELALNRNKFYVPDSSIEDCQKIWSQVTEKLNSLSKDCNIPVVKWQRYWKNAKRNVGKLRPFLEEKLKSDGKNIDLPKYSPEELDLLEFCNVSPTDSADKISAALFNDFELGRRFLTSPFGLLLPPGLDFTTYMASHPNKCRRCPAFFDGPQIGYCEVCATIPRTKCDMCRKDYNHELKIYPIAQWAKTGKDLVSKMYNYNELTICLPCMEPLNRKATEMWKACRFCKASDRALENLYSPNLRGLLGKFMEVTKKTFSETDGLPGYVCKACKIQMQHVNGFYLKFSKAQSHLEETHITKFIEEKDGKAKPCANKPKDRNQSPVPLSSESIANVPGENLDSSSCSTPLRTRHRMNEEDTENEPPSKQRCGHDLSKQASYLSLDLNSVRTKTIEPIQPDPWCKIPVALPIPSVSAIEVTSQPMPVPRPSTSAFASASQPIQDNVVQSNNAPMVSIKTEIVDKSYPDIESKFKQHNGKYFPVPFIKEEVVSDDEDTTRSMVNKEIVEANDELEVEQIIEQNEIEVPMEIACEEIVETTVEHIPKANQMETPEINAGRRNIDIRPSQETFHELTPITAVQIIKINEKPYALELFRTFHEPAPMAIPQIIALDLTAEQTNPMRTPWINPGKQRHNVRIPGSISHIIARDRNAKAAVLMETQRINAGAVARPRLMETSRFVTGEQNANEANPMTTSQMMALDLTAEQKNPIKTSAINAGEEINAAPIRMTTSQINPRDGDSVAVRRKIIEGEKNEAPAIELKSTIDHP